MNEPSSVAVCFTYVFSPLCLFEKLTCCHKETLNYSGLNIKFPSCSEKLPAVCWAESFEVSSMLSPRRVLENSPTFSRYLSTYYLKGAGSHFMRETVSTSSES